MDVRAHPYQEPYQEQFLRIIDTLIANQEIKNILLEQIKEKPPPHFINELDKIGLQFINIRSTWLGRLFS